MYSNDDGIELEMSSRQRTFGSRVAVIRCQCNNMTTEMSWRYIVVVPAKGDGQRVRFRSFSVAMLKRGSHVEV
jgi:hypothetical protein